MAYSSKYCLARLVALLVLISLSESAPEKAMLMSFDQAMEDLMSCQGVHALLTNTNISPLEIKFVCEYLKHVASSVRDSQDKATDQLPNIDTSAASRSDVHSYKAPLTNDAHFILERYKKLETMKAGPNPRGRGHKKNP
ncbi:hypothetical protein OROMI_003205 [Orobanche minor]